MKSAFKSPFAVGGGIGLVYFLPMLISKSYQLGVGLKVVMPVLLMVWVAGGLIMLLIVRWSPARSKSSTLRLLALSLYDLAILGLVDPLEGKAASHQYFFVIGSVVSVAAIWSIAHLPEEKWKRVERALIIGSLIFSFSPVVIAYLSVFGHQPISTFGTRAFGDGIWDKNNILIVVLDETSPEYTPVLVRALQDSGLISVQGEVKAAGRNTLNAIPSMLTGFRYDDVTPCDATTLCGENALDFSRLRVENQNTDVVGFFHPYCSIEGVRFCHLGSYPTAVENVGLFAWAIDWARRKSCAYKNFFLWCSGVQYANDNYVWLEMRKDVVNNIYYAPFWKVGGVLYAHVPLPHLPADREYSSLSAAYNANVVQSAALLRSLGMKLKYTFKDDFALIVTSDHPFRNSLWCPPDRWDRECRGLPPNRNMVPLIIASTKEIDVHLPASNAGIFAAGK